jgi:hypothetical protein
MLRALLLRFSATCPVIVARVFVFTAAYVRQTQTTISDAQVFVLRAASVATFISRRGLVQSAVRPRREKRLYRISLVELVRLLVL